MRTTTSLRKKRLGHSPPRKRRLPAQQNDELLPAPSTRLEFTRTLAVAPTDPDGELPAFDHDELQGEISEIFNMNEGYTAQNILKVEGIPRRANVQYLASLAEESRNVSRLQKKTHSLRWHNLCVRAQDKMILNGLTGEVKTGEMAAIMGPSGCGKTTLLKLLAGRTNYLKNSWERSGSVALNRIGVLDKILKTEIAYVMQEDVFYPSLTVYEECVFAAKLKLPQEKCVPAIRHELIKDLLEKLDLWEARDKAIGSQIKKGISGGQKKRLSIAVELLTRPRMILIDEPTSGLDAVAAYEVMKILRELASDGHLVLCTIHQPSSEIYQMFDNLILLRAGRTLYDGPSEKVLDWFASDGKQPDSRGTNPGDFCLFTIRRFSEAEAVNKAKHWEEHSKKRYDEIFKSIRVLLETGQMNVRHHKSFCVQFRVLVGRAIKSIMRARGPMLTAMVMPIITDSLQAALAYQTIVKKEVSALEGTCTKNLESICAFSASYCPDLNGGVTEALPTLEKRNVLIVWALISVIQIIVINNVQSASVATIPIEAPVRKKEMQSNLYTAGPLFASKGIIWIPFQTICGWVANTIMYWACPFYGGWALYGVVGLMHFTAISVMWLVAIFSSDVRVVMQTSNIVVLFCFIFSGIFVPIKEMPSYLQPLEVFSIAKYGINMFAIIELPEEIYDPLLERQNVDREKFWVYAGIILGIGVLSFLGLIFFTNRQAMGEGPRRVADARIARPSWQVMSGSGKEAEEARTPTIVYPKKIGPVVTIVQYPGGGMGGCDEFVSPPSRGRRCSGEIPLNLCDSPAFGLEIEVGIVASRSKTGCSNEASPTDKGLILL